MAKLESGRSFGISRRSALFAGSQAILAPGLAWAALQGYRSGSEDPRLPDLLDHPRRVLPQRDDPRVVTDSQLISILDRMRIPQGKFRRKINHLDHALRMWGTMVEFGDARWMSSRKMLAIMTQDSTFRGDWGDSARPLITQYRGQPTMRTQEGAASSSHVDHTLATFAEIGLPLTYRLEGRHREYRLKELVQESLRRFSINQIEYEWTALILGLYAEDHRPWVSRESQRITFDMIAERIMRQRLGEGVCYGGHRLYTLTLLRRIDGRQPIFTDSMARRVDRHLQEATRRLVQSQSEAGFWDQRWPGYALHGSNELWSMGRQLLTTGHALEWWAMAPEWCLPPRESIVRGAQWVVQAIQRLDDEDVRKNYTFLTHAARALSLWRGKMPGAWYQADGGYEC